jgi:hypothetical protein
MPERLGDVSGASPDDLWIAGDDSAAAGFVPSAAHWDGEAWSRAVSDLSAGDREGLFSTVLTTSDGTTWAAGYVGVGPSAVPYLTTIHVPSS